MQPSPDDPQDPRDPPAGPERDDALAAEAARLERAAAFLAAHQDEPLTPPLVIAGLLALAWWVLLGWQALSWWPTPGASAQVAAGVGRVERGADGDLRALTVGDGAGAVRFECATRGRWQLRVMHVPLVECREAEYVFSAAQGRGVHVRYDQPAAGGTRFNRLLTLTADGQPLWTADDSAHAFAWHGIRAGMLAAVFLLPGWWLHRFRRRRG